MAVDKPPEIPAEHIDPAAIDLTPLVNTLINTSQSGSRQLFSLLSVTSYSSLALHKLTLLVYNISSIRSIESNRFRRRFCYCVTNETNDLTDFTAILLDVMGNSTSYLHELFKSASILSVSQRNNSDCIYICVMAGKMGREVSELWEVDSITPLFNQTIIEGPHRVGNVSSIRFPFEWHHHPTNLSHISPSGMSSMLTSRVHSTAHGESLQEAAVHVCFTNNYGGNSCYNSKDHHCPAAGSSSTTYNHDATKSNYSRWTGDDNKRDDTGSNNTSSDHGADDSNRKTNNNFTTNSINATNQRQAAHHCTCYNSCSSDNINSYISHEYNPADHSVNQTHHVPARCWSDPTNHTPAKNYNNNPARDFNSSSAETFTCPSHSRTHGCPWRRPELTDVSLSDSTTTVSAHKLQPCVLELCKFFSQCLCRPFSHKTRMKRYCDDSHVWYEKHTSEVCRRVRRVSFSRNLKQRCLTKMCNKL
ncbi:HERV-H LTR-associating protein 1 [Symphorus nematophorus]